MKTTNDYNIIYHNWVDLHKKQNVKDALSVAFDDTVDCIIYEERVSRQEAINHLSDILPGMVHERNAAC